MLFVNAPEERLERALAELAGIGLRAGSIFRDSTIACTGIDFCRVASPPGKVVAPAAIVALEALRKVVTRSRRSRAV